MNELPHLIIIIFILGVGYAAIRVWSARTKISRESSSGSRGGGASGGAIDHLADVIDHSSIPRPARNKDRFHLTGKDAEMAAKVLKRMLQADVGEKKK